MPKKGRYHHIKFDDDEEFETPAFQFLNEDKEDGVNGKKSVGSDDDDVHLEDSDNESLDIGADSDEDDDEAPEDVSFKTGKQTALQQMKDAIQNIKEGKLKVKEKRRKINEQFTEQKKRKLEELKQARLSDDFLEALDKLPSKPKKTKNTGTDHVKNDLIERNSLQDEEDEGSFADTEDDFDQNADFIPFDSEDHDRLGGVDVKPLKEYEKTTMSRAITAAEFKYRHLYGGKIPREPIKDKLAKMKKKNCI